MDMKIVDALWEKRNLGVDVFEIVFDQDDVDFQIDRIRELKADLVYVKIPYRNLSIVQMLEKSGFEYVENQFCIQKKIRYIDDLLPLYKHNIEDYTYDIITKKVDVHFLCNEVNNGMFDTDRIALESRFGKGVANRRYVNWIQDLSEKKNNIISFVINKNTNEKVGFFINDISNNRYAEGVLGGIFNSYKSTGLSHFYIYYALLCAKKLGHKTFRTNISSNNLEVFNIYSAVFSFNIINNFVVLRKFS